MNINFLKNTNILEDESDVKDVHKQSSLRRLRHGNNQISQGSIIGVNFLLVT